jgi:hypothetical protein
MKRIWTGVLAALVATGLAWGQEGGEKKEGKAAPKPEAREGAKDGGKEPAKGPGPMLAIAEVDLNGDGWLSAFELKTALSRLGGGEKEGGKVPVKDGEGKKLPAKPDAPKEGGKEAPKEGQKDAPKKGDAPREGDKK